MSAVRRTVFFAFALFTFLSLNVSAMPFPEEVAKWTPTDKQQQREAGEKLLERLAAAVKAKEKVFTVPKGIYRFAKTVGKRPAHIGLHDVKNLLIEGNGSHFYFENFSTAIQIYKAENLTVRNLFLDWDPLPFTQGAVVEIDHKDNSFTFKTEKGYEQLYDALFKSASNRGMLFDAKDRKLKSGQGGFCLQVVKKLSDDTFKVKVRGFYGRKAGECGIAPGDMIVLLARMGRAVTVEVSAKVTLENVMLYASPFVGFCENVGEGGNVYRNCGIVKRPGTTRLIGGNADGFNCAGTLKGPLLDRCRIENIGDDFVNIHGVYYRIFEQKSPTVLVVQPFGSNGVKTPCLSFLENKTWAFKGDRTVVSSKVFTYTIPESSREALKAKWAAAMNYQSGTKVRAMEIVLDKPLELTSAAIFSVASANSDGAVIRNCDFSGSLARGIRFQSQDAVIENNIIARCLGPGLTTAGQPGFWGEAVTSRKLKVTGNSFIECGIAGPGVNRLRAAVEITAPGELATGYLTSGIVFADNRIVRPGDCGIYLNNCTDITVRDNTFEEVGVKAPANGTNSAAPILTGDIGKVKIENNKFVKNGKYSSGPDVRKVK